METASGGERTAMCRAKIPGYMACSSVAHLNVASSSVPSHSAHFFGVSGRGPGRSYTSTPLTSVHVHYELLVESMCVRV